jgi:hypothetical protein
VRPLFALPLGVSLAGLALAIAACSGDDGGERVFASPPDGGPPVASDGGDGGLPEEDADATTDGGDGGISPVLLGISANAPAEEPGASGETSALLTTFAVGVRAVVVSPTLAELDDVGLARLGQLATLFAEQGKASTLELRIVDDAADGRPAELAALPWSDPTLAAAVDARIDEAIGALGGGLRFVVLGRDVDRYLAAHPSESFELKLFLAHALETAKAQAGEAVPVGIGWSFEAATSASLRPAELDDASTLVATALLAGAPIAGAAPPGGTAAALDALVLSAGPRPIVLTALGATSGEDAGGTVEAQAAFFDGFFEALAPRRSAFALVNVRELHEREPAACDALALAHGEPAGGDYAAFVCSLGLFDADGAPKPAWAAVTSAVASFASP